MVYQFKEHIPVIDPSSFIHPLAAVTGNVEIGKHVYVGPGAAIRGDFGSVIIEDGCNVQENCVLHTFPGARVLLQENAHIGHGAIIHGSTIGRNCLIGMNAVVMDDVVLEEECIVGAQSFVRQGSHFERRSLIAGNPATRIKDVSDEMIGWKTEGTKIYQQLAADMLRYWRPCEPLSEKKETAKQKKQYKPWNSSK